MALSSIRRRRRPAEQQVIDEGIRFIMNSVRPDGSWPIDTNLATWVTTLSVNALAAAGDLESLDTKEQILTWLLNQQYKERHPYTGADPGGWAWTDLPGGVPDCDDTPGVMLAITTLGYNEDLPKDVPFGAGFEAINWLTSLQNRDGGWPTFCRGWGVLPFDRSGADLTAHALRALTCWSMKWFGHVAGGDPKNQPDYDEMVEKVGSWWDAWSRVEIDFDNSAVDGIRFLSEQQRPDGSWLPLWFGNQHAKDDINPVYGTARVLAAYRDLNMTDSPECQRGVTYLLSVQNADGGWGGAKDCPSSVEETALAVEVLVDLVQPREGEAPAEPNHVPGSAGASHVPGSAGASPSHEIQRGLAWLVEAVESGRFREPSPIGFYFAKLWYFEKLYPLIFTVAALGRARLTSSPAAVGSA
jgi:squalene-hopene/tetraprenyl-beta-curcumene cyclase